jgi:hypothetical protein
MDEREHTDKPEEQIEIEPLVWIKQNSLRTPDVLQNISSNSIIEIEPSGIRQVPERTVQAHRIDAKEHLDPLKQRWMGSGKFRVVKNQTVTVQRMTKLIPPKYNYLHVNNWTILQCVEHGFGNHTGDEFAFFDDGIQIQETRLNIKKLS